MSVRLETVAGEHASVEIEAGELSVQASDVKLRQLSTERSGGGGLESLMVTVGVRLSDLAASVKSEKPLESLARAGGGGSWRGRVDAELFSLQALAVYTTLLGKAIMPSEPVTAELSGLRVVVTTEALRLLASARVPEKDRDGSGQSLSPTLRPLNAPESAPLSVRLHMHDLRLELGPASVGTTSPDTFTEDRASPRKSTADGAKSRARSLSRGSRSSSRDARARSTSPDAQGRSAGTREGWVVLECLHGVLEAQK
ncbi:hypothetical protein T484DRAFT_1884462, partial [Baffinella frigidus]